MKSRCKLAASLLQACLAGATAHNVCVPAANSQKQKSFICHANTHHQQCVCAPPPGLPGWHHRPAVCTCLQEEIHNNSSTGISRVGVELPTGLLQACLAGITAHRVRVCLQHACLVQQHRDQQSRCRPLYQACLAGINVHRVCMPANSCIYYGTTAARRSAKTYAGWM
jgi:hypothetical protein